MRVGQNPARYIKKVAQPENLSIVIVNFIPFLSGFYEQSLEVLKVCINSLWENTNQPFDLLVFDNHSCLTVREYLLDLYSQSKIQYLVLSEKNIGKMGAWNFMFSAAQGEYVGFADADILFRSGWLSESLMLMNTFPNVGMVTARPLRVPIEFSKSTIEWSRKQGNLAQGQYQDWSVYWEHALSVGLSEERAQKKYQEGFDYRINYQGINAFIGAGHFQFLTRKDVIGKILPIPSIRPMRDVRELDIAIDSFGYLRLTTEKPFVKHMGNRLLVGNDHEQGKSFSPRSRSLLNKLLWVPGIKNILLWFHNKIFQLYFENLE